VGRALEPLVLQLNEKIFGKQIITPTIALAGAVFIGILLLIIIIKALSGKKKKRDTLLLLGLPNSGKTALFYKV
jgi:hypothetical protein